MKHGKHPVKQSTAKSGGSGSGKHPSGKAVAKPNKAAERRRVAEERRHEAANRLQEDEELLLHKKNEEGERESCVNHSASMFILTCWA